MTKTDFAPVFERLCRGFRHEATPEQAEAWYKRVNHAEAADWHDAVTTLLCAPKFPYLDTAMGAIDDAANHRRARARQCERKQAERVYTKIQSQEGPFSPMLFRAIKALGARRQIRDCIERVAKADRWADAPTAQARELERLREQEQVYSTELTALLPQLEETELSQFLSRYGSAEVAA